MIEVLITWKYDAISFKRKWNKLQNSVQFYRMKWKKGQGSDFDWIEIQVKPNVAFKSCKSF